MAADVSTLGVITEQGDLGLGFSQVTKEEAQTVEKNDKDQKSE